MLNLAIKGHAIRGNEVIEILKTFGGINSCFKLDGKIESFHYYIGNNNHIYHASLSSEMKCFTLEEFLEKYPYKIGDKVEYKSNGDTNLKSKIIYMEWCNALNKVLYITEDAHVISTEDITETKSIPLYMDCDIKEDIEKNQPPKTQVEVDKYLQEHSVKNAMNVVDIETCLETDGLKLPENVVINSKGIGSIQFIQWYEKHQYPKTYEECCEVLNLGEDGNLYTKGHQASLIQDFHKLFICRAAYWKIAGEQMGLDKPWEPDWGENDGGYRYCIRNQSNKIVLSNEWLGENYILSFPTTEMRDEFYENFKDLIEYCKELL